MTAASRGFLCLLLATIPLGYWVGRTLALANRLDSSSAVAGLSDNKRETRKDDLHGPLQRPPSKNPNETKAMKGRPAWDPWQKGKDIVLPLSFFKNFWCGVRDLQKPEQRLNEGVLRAIGVPAQQVPVVQEAYSGHNNQMVAADLKHRKVLRNDRDAVEIEVPAYPAEAQKIKEEFNSRVSEVIGPGKAALLDVMITGEAAMRENRGLNRRVFKLTPANDGSVKIEETVYSNTGGKSESQYSTKGDVDSNLKHLFKIEAANTDPPAGP